MQTAPMQTILQCRLPSNPDCSFNADRQCKRFMNESEFATCCTAVIDSWWTLTFLVDRFWLAKVFEFYFLSSTFKISPSPLPFDRLNDSLCLQRAPASAIRTFPIRAFKSELSIWSLQLSEFSLDSKLWSLKFRVFSSEPSVRLKAKSTDNLPNQPVSFSRLIWLG